MKFLDLFAGIGGFRLGMERAGHKCIGFCEIDRFARASYKAIHDTEGEIELHDITAVTDEFIRGIGSVDVICGGFPCQAFSIAGNRRGFEDTRGTLFFEIARFASILRPRYLFLENVKGLLNHEGGATFETIISTLDELGYNVEWQVFNSKNFGVPQNRERVFLIGHLRGTGSRPIFPFGGENTELVEKSTAIKVVGNTKNPESSMLGTKTEVYDPTGISGTLMATDYKGPKQIIVKSLGNVNPSGNGMNGEVYQADGLAPTLTTNKGEGQKIAIPVLTPDRSEKRQNGRRFKENGEPMFTSTSQDIHGVMVESEIKVIGKIEPNFNQSGCVYDPSGIAPTIRTMQGGGNEPKIIQRPRGENKGGFHEIAPTVTNNSYHENNHLSDGFRIRKLTPRECWRLQGFPDWAFDRAKEVNSNSQLYKQAGNSVTVNVIEAIARRIR